MLAVAAQPRRRPAAALTAASSPATARCRAPTPWWSRKCRPRRAYPERRDAAPQRRVVAIAGIEQRDAARQARFARPAQLLKRDLRLGLELHLLGNPCLAPALAIIAPSLAADKADRPPAGSHDDWPATAIPRPGSCPACQAARNIAAPPQPNADPAWESRYRR